MKLQSFASVGAIFALVIPAIAAPIEDRQPLNLNPIGNISDPVKGQGTQPNDQIDIVELVQREIESALCARDPDGGNCVIKREDDAALCARDPDGGNCVIKREDDAALCARDPDGGNCVIKREDGAHTI